MTIRPPAETLLHLLGLERRLRQPGFLSRMTTLLCTGNAALLGLYATPRQVVSQVFAS